MSHNTTYKTITREQFLFHEMRVTARLMNAGKSDTEIAEEIFTNNLFQYPTERMIRNIVSVCIRRLHALGSDQAIEIIAEGPAASAKQACLYAMMKQYLLIREFMCTVIADKYRTKDFNYSRRELNAFFSRLQEQNDVVASWTVATINKCKSVINRILIETEYLDTARSETLNPVLIEPELKQIMLEKRDYVYLAAFNCFEGE